VVVAVAMLSQVRPANVMAEPKKEDEEEGEDEKVYAIILYY
jgi:hypothetical protein